MEGAPTIHAPQVSSVFGSAPLFAHLQLQGSSLELPSFIPPEPPEEEDKDSDDGYLYAHQLPPEEPLYVEEGHEGLPPADLLPNSDEPTRSSSNLAPVLPPVPPLQDTYPIFYSGQSFPRGVGEDCPWLRQYSARVTASASCLIPGPSKYRGKARVRLALGGEDGVIRIFAGEDDEELERAMEASEDPEPDSPASAVTFDASRTPHSSPRRGDRSPARSRPLSPSSPTRSLMRLGIGSPNGHHLPNSRDRSTSMASTSTARSRIGGLFGLPPPPPIGERRTSSSASSTATEDEYGGRSNKAVATVSVSDFDAEAVLPTSPTPASSSSKAKAGRHQRNKPSISVSALNAVTVPSSRPMLESLRRISSSTSTPSPTATNPSTPRPPSPNKSSPTHPRSSNVSLDKAWSSTTSLVSQPSPPLERRFSLNGIDERPSLDLLLSSPSAADRDPWGGTKLKHMVDAVPRIGGGSLVKMEVVEGAVGGTEEDEEVGDGRAVVCLTDEGRLSKVSIIDGHCFASVELGRPDEGRTTFTGFSVVALPSDAFILCFAPTAGICVPVRLSDFSTLLPLSFPSPAPTRHMSLVESYDGHNLLLVTSTGHATLASVLLSDESVSVGEPRSISEALYGDSGSACEGAISFGSRAAIWGGETLHLWDLSTGAIAWRSKVETPEVIEDVIFCSSQMVAVRFKGSMAMYELDGASTLKLRGTYGADGSEFVAPLPPLHVDVRLLVSARPEGKPRHLELTGISAFDHGSPVHPREKPKPVQMTGRTLFRAKEVKGAPGAVHVTATKLVDDLLYLGDSSGGLTALGLERSGRWAARHVAGYRMDGAVIEAFPCDSIVLASMSMGQLVAFDSDLTNPRGATISYSSIDRVARMDAPEISAPYAGSYLCAAQCGDVYFFTVEQTSINLIAAFPANGSPCRDIWLDDDKMLTAHEDGVAFEWDLVKQEVRRETTIAAAYAAVDSTPTWGAVAFADGTGEGVAIGGTRATCVSLRQLADDAADFKKGSKKAMPTARLLLSRALADSGLPKATLKDLRKHLNVEPAQDDLLIPDCLPSATVGSGGSPFSLSHRATASHLLSLTILLRTFLNDAPSERHASQAVVALTMLPETVGASFKDPSLDIFATFWLDQSHEIREAARMLFGASLSRLSDHRVRVVASKWQPLLPVNAPSLASTSDQAHALLVVGLIASERYKLLSSTLLKNLAASIQKSLAADSPAILQAVSVELCSRSFGILQHFVDAMDVMRTLFGLATGRDARTSNELRTMGKHAVLQVAAVNTPLFMTTLSYDLVSASEASHRIATMKLVAFMVRKKPRILHTSLPRLAEAVVKSLDPTHKVIREATQSAATVILHELVKTYPSIAFHGRTQRLAVGTQEGAVIVYDVKTATRLYVLGRHKRAVTACSFSPDGHRLVSVSLEEGRAEVWKVGAGVLGYLTPGAPPRQGTFASLIGGSNAGPTTPFKTFPFNVGEEGNMSTAATLEWVVIEWPAERSCRLRIRESALTFAV